MKREIDRAVYANTLEFLAVRIELYERYLIAATDDPEEKKRFRSILDSCIDIREMFVKTYKPKKIKKREAQSSGKE